jgi:hypothetical protein
VEFLTTMARQSLESISLMQDIKRLFPKNSEEEIDAGVIIREEFLIVKRLMKEAENVKRNQKS